MAPDDSGMPPDQDNRALWEKRYRDGAGRIHYPFEHVVSFVLGEVGRGDRSAASVLDFGCGPGNHLWFLVENGYQAWGIDSAETAVGLAQEAVIGVAPSYPVEERIVHYGGLELPFGDAMFDAVIDRSSLGQNPAGDLPGLVSEIHRVLKPGGQYFGINFSDQHPELAKGQAVGQGDFAEFTSGIFKGIGTRHFFGVAEVRDLFADFDIKDIRLLEDRSVMGGTSHVQILVQAARPASKRPEK